jgi:hypothetical protein
MKKHRATFRTYYILYVFILILLLVAVYFSVRSILVSYEQSVSDKTAVRLVENATGKSSELWQYMNDRCFGADQPGDPAARKQRFESTIARAKLTAVPAAGNYDSQHPVYNILADGKPFLTIALKETSTTTKLGILTQSEWDVESCFLRAENAENADIRLNPDHTYSCTISAPSDFTVRIDGVTAPLANAEYAPLDEFQYVAPFTGVPELMTWTFENLPFEPTVTVVNNAGENVELTEKNGVYTAEVKFASTAEAERIGSAAVDALAIGELWSKFMTNDVGGDARGLYTVINNCRLIPKSDLYKKATSWANSIDITFVSGHTIDSWTNERVTNYVLYSDDLFSCDVFFEKNMTLKTGAKRTDVFNYRLYFVNNRDAANGTTGWRLADMAAL